MYRINDRSTIVPAETIRRLGRLPVPVIGDALGRFGCMHSSIKPLSDAMRFAGPALTVRPTGRTTSCAMWPWRWRIPATSLSSTPVASVRRGFGEL